MIYKNTIIKIKASLGRYLSLFVIILIGVGFYAGIQASAPDIVMLADSYYGDHSLADFKIISPLGLTEEDINVIKEVSGIHSVTGSYSLDAIEGEKAVRLHALEDDVNQVRLVSGRMPENETECLADSRNYSIGDSIVISGEANGVLRKTEFTITGLVDSVLYIAKDYGSTTVGDGKLTSFLFIDKDVFRMNAYSELYVTIVDAKNDMAYSEEYNAKVLAIKEELVKQKPEREQTRYFEVFGKPAEATKEVPQWVILGREAANGYDSLNSDIEVISSVAKVFPFFFILIAMLMTSNTMARMIAEERSELGTLTSLGYRDQAIISTYLLYVLSASIAGTVVGYFLGCRVFPPLIFDNFDYILPPFVTYYNFLTLALIMGVTLTLMSVVTVTACRRELKEKPAVLMRPLPPKHGQKILLERVTGLWNSLSFTWKVTMRNMFRYKKRAFMTIVGIAGCSSLLLVGFGLRGSMDGIAEKQFGDIFRYDATAVLKNEVSEISGALEALLESENIENSLLLTQSAITCGQDVVDLDAFLIVPEDERLFSEYYHLTEKQNGKPVELLQNGVILSEKLAESLHLKKSDTFILKGDDNNAYSVTVSHIVENYVSNYVYMSKELYEQTFDQDALYNSFVFNASGDEQVLAKTLMESELFVKLTFTSDIVQSVLDGNARLNSIILLLIIVASLLAVIVLYNLTSINISERKREIATLKVLGFHDGETNAYIYREALILTLISIMAGLLFGIVLHRFVIIVIEGTSRVLFKEIHWSSFIISGSMTMVFSIVMQVVTYFKLKTVDMIESLKSIE